MLMPANGGESRCIMTDKELLSANLEFLLNAKQEIFEVFEELRNKFDGSEYQQGKKDGLRIALALLGNPEMMSFNRGGANQNPTAAAKDAP